MSLKTGANPLTVIYAAYHHDLVYQHFFDTATKYVANRLLIEEMDATKHSTLREIVEQNIIRSVINAIQKFCMGINRS